MWFSGCDIFITSVVGANLFEEAKPGIPGCCANTISLLLPAAAIIVLSSIAFVICALVAPPAESILMMSCTQEAKMKYCSRCDFGQDQWETTAIDL
jgi:hypothetical protein